MTDQAVIEAMLLRWGESPTGRTVTFLLPDDGEGHPFKGLPTGPTNGQRLALSVVLINDDETTKPKPNGSEKPKSYAQEAGRLCNDPSFQRWMGVDGHIVPANTAKMVIYRDLGISSRRELIEGTEAGKTWRDWIAEFNAWKMK